MKAHVIALGNEKGGSGKSTTAMHLFVALARGGAKVGAIDLDVRQQSFFRYLENRRAYCERNGASLLMPETREVPASGLNDRGEANRDEAERFGLALAGLSDSCDYIVIDCPGSHTNLSEQAHAAADTLITPLNDSLIDFDLLARVDPATGEILGPSIYSEMVWRCRQLRAADGRAPTDWVVMRNRIATLDAKNKQRMAGMIDALADRIRFRVAPGFSERVIFRELFLSGLTLLDLREKGAGVKMNMSHVAARQEVRALMAQLRLPGLEAAA